MPEPAYDPRYLEGLRRFNARDFFAAHEIWEGVWGDEQGTPRRFYQGLIQVAVCLHHFRRGNTRGARKLYHTSRGYLDPCRPQYLGLDVDRLMADLERCCAELLADTGDVPRATLRPELIPTLALLSPGFPRESGGAAPVEPRSTGASAGAASSRPDVPVTGQDAIQTASTDGTSSPPGASRGRAAMVSEGPSRPS